MASARLMLRIGTMSCLDASWRSRVIEDEAMAAAALDEVTESEVTRFVAKALAERPRVPAGTVPGGASKEVGVDSSDVEGGAEAAGAATSCGKSGRSTRRAAPRFLPLLGMTARNP